MQVADSLFSISSDKSKLDLHFVHRFLSQSYWAEGIPIDVVKRSIDGSLCFGVFDNDRQVGFARVITDEATFAYLADVFVDEEYRGRGLSKLLMETIINTPSLQGLRRFLLATRDAHGLYEKFGFKPLTHTSPWMQIHNPEIYKQPAAAADESSGD